MCAKDELYIHLVEENLLEENLLISAHYLPFLGIKRFGRY